MALEHLNRCPKCNSLMQPLSDKQLVFYPVCLDCGFTEANKKGEPMTLQQPTLDTTKVMLNIERDRESLGILNEIVAIGNEETIIKSIIDNYGEEGINIPAARVEAAIEETLNDYSAHAISPGFKIASKSQQFFVGLVGATTVVPTVACAVYVIVHFLG